MNKGYVEYRLRLKQLEYDEKRVDFLRLVNNELDTDSFERNAISLLISMQGLKDTINEVKLLQEV